MYKGCNGIKAETRVYLERPLKLYLEWTGFAPHPPRAGVGVQGGRRGGLCFPLTPLLQTSDWVKRMVCLTGQTAMSSASRQCLKKSAIAVVQIGGITPVGKGGKLPEATRHRSCAVLCYTVTAA